MDKFPELEEHFDAADAPSGDFLSREKDVLGDGAAEFDNGEAPVLFSDEDEAAEFQSNYPALETEETELTPSVVASAASLSLEAPSSSEPAVESEFIREWKAKKELELERLDKANEERQNEIRINAQKAIDSFYENYNSKRGQNLESVRKEAEAFVEERNKTNTGSTWERIATLIAEVPASAEGVKPANKLRFKELISSLKGDVNAPGAGGY